MKRWLYGTNFSQPSAISLFLLFTKRKIKIFTPIAYQVLSEQASAVTAYPTLSQLLDSYYHEKAEKDRAKQQGGELIRKIENELKRNKNKLKKREQTLKESENAENYRRNGELLTTFLTQVPRGAKKLFYLIIMKKIGQSK